MTVAGRVITKCGGAKEVSKAIGMKTTVGVYKWTYPKDKGGTGGLIPAKHHSALLRSFPQLTPEDFQEEFTA